MRVKRLKHCKKIVNFYKTTFGFRQPFQVLVDLTFCQFALTYKINIKEQVSNYIEGDSLLYTTNCILEEGKSLGPQLYGAVLVCKQFKLRKCNHRKPVSAQACILSIIGEDNPHHFFVSTQDKELCDQLKKIPGVPLLYIHYNSLVLEKPSKGTLDRGDQIDSVKTMTSSVEKERLQQLKKLQNVEEEKEPRPKRRKAKGVNPLAMKKKKKKAKDSIPIKDANSIKKRRKKKRKIAAHVLQELKKMKNASADNDVVQ
ncbi:rRNA-processing protein UTP23 homolog isoform X3 [Hydra vulgaris]|uniref:rRNA-processing protein UTP23 homolog isoform X3 n=1 Tax=Hydra vulgaris TaxID=6087 RepID=A0ABM4DJB5_HYDVU